MTRFGRARVALLVPLALCAAACRQQMAEQPYHRPLDPAPLFGDGRLARPLPDGTVARGRLLDDPHLETGRVGDKFVDTFPFEVTDDVLARGRQRYDIYCAVCHDRVGTGQGRIVQRGFLPPPNLHTDLSRGYKLRGADQPLRTAPVGYIYDVVTRGYGAMPDHAAQVPVRDRWAIVAHVRLLQISQNLPLDQLPPAERDAHFGQGGRP